MLTFEEAHKQAESYLVKMGPELFGRSDLVVVDKFIREHRLGWVVPYNTLKFTQTGFPLDGLVGNRPLFIDRENGRVHIIPVGSIDDWLDKYPGPSVLKPV